MSNSGRASTSRAVQGRHDLKGQHSLLKLLTLDFQISTDLSISTSRELSGKVRFEEVGLCRGLKALF